MMILVERKPRLGSAFLFTWHFDQNQLRLDTLSYLNLEFILVKLLFRMKFGLVSSAMFIT